MLGLVAEGPIHPFALARLLSANGSLGRVCTVRRPQVYRAVDRLAAGGLIEAERTEPGEGGPERTVYRITPQGATLLDAWLGEPVRHVRELRISFLLKLALLRRSGRSPARLVAAQRRALEPTLAALGELPPVPDEIDLWRHHGAAATESFLEALREVHGDPSAR